MVLREPDLLTKEREILDFCCECMCEQIWSLVRVEQDLKGEETDQGVEAVKSIQNVHLADHESKKKENTLNIERKQVCTKIQTLRSSKKSDKTRLTKAKKQLNDLIEKQLPVVPLPSTNAIRRAINKVNSEISIIEKIISGLR